MRKVLGMTFTKRKREIYNTIAVIFLVVAVIVTYFVCEITGEEFADGWASSLGESCVAFVLLMLQIRFVQEISSLIKEADLDLVPVTRSFCANLSVVGFIFLVQIGDLCLHIIGNLYLKKTELDSSELQADKTLFIVVAILVQILLLSAYFSFFLLVFRSTMGARTFEDLILHKDVPELVYLQTRKMLRD